MRGIKIWWESTGGDFSRSGGEQIFGWWGEGIPPSPPVEKTLPTCVKFN